MTEKQRAGIFALMVNPGKLTRSRESEQELTQTQAEYLVYKAVVERAVEVFGDDLRASRWLSRRQPDFGGKSPLEDLSDASFDPQNVLAILDKIEHGVYF